MNALILNASLTRLLRATSLALSSGLFLATASAATLTTSWVDNSTDETGFSVERSQNGTSFTEIARVPANTTSYGDAGLSAGQYWYRVRAFNNSNFSAYSDIVSGTVAAATPTPTPTPTPAPVVAVSPSAPVTSTNNATTPSNSTTTTTNNTTPSTALGNLLTGTVIASSPWNNQTAYEGAKVFDNDTASFFSGKSTDALVYVGLDLGSAKKVSAISFFPRTGFATRMTGGLFRGANKADLSDAVTLYTIPSAPTQGQWQTVSLPTSVLRYRYVFYTTASVNQADVAEIKLYEASQASAVSYLSGTTISSTAWNGLAAYVGAKAFDDDVTTFFSGRSTDALVYVGQDLGMAKVIDAISFYPRTGYTARMNGGLFRGANKADLSDAVTLYTVPSTPVQGQWTDVTLPASTKAYRYVFFTTVSTNSADVAELEFYGHDAAGTELTGSSISSAPWNNIATYQGSKATDGDTTTFFSGRSTDAFVYVGLDLGTASKVSTIKFFPRTGYTARMNGGKFCGANKADFSDAVTLYTVPSAPTEGQWQTVTLPASSTAYRYVYFTTASANFGDIAEMKFFAP